LEGIKTVVDRGAWQTKTGPYRGRKNPKASKSVSWKVEVRSVRGPDTSGEDACGEEEGVSSAHAKRSNTKAH